MKNKKQKKILTPYRQEMRKISIILSMLMGVLLLAVICLCWVDWKYSLCAAIFGVWSACWYRYGKYAQVIDKYEKDGYPDDGLRCMFKSWIIFAILSVIVYAVYYGYCASL